MSRAKQARNSTTEATPPERRGLSRRTVIEEARAKVSVDELAEHLGTELRTSGKELRGRCPLHGGENPTSFAVDAEEGLWNCYSCARGGDVVELARYAWGYEKHEVAMACADLLHTFNHPIPPRPASWARKQSRQRDTRDVIEHTRRSIYRRRLFKYLILPALEHIEDDAEYVRELERTWAEFEDLLS
jgi:DNA primase